MGSLDFGVTRRCLSDNTLSIRLLMAADCAVHQRTDRTSHGWGDRFSGYAIPSCIPPNDEAESGTPLAELLVEVTFCTWRFVSLAPHVLPRDARDGIPG